jgi:GNAT superfamily N-acetyltransferase
VTRIVVIRTASRADAALCAGILTAALVDDPVARWLIADRHDRWRIHCRYFHRFVCHGVDAGTVQIANEDACAVWFPSTASDAVDLDSDLAVLCEQYAQRFSLFGRIMHERHPDGPAHEYLMLLGAKPDQQSQRLGFALLTHHLARLDAVGMPSYLEATTRRSADGIYARAGYRPLGEPIRFPEGLQVYPLWRDRRPTQGVV